LDFATTRLAWLAGPGLTFSLRFLPGLTAEHAAGGSFTSGRALRQQFAPSFSISLRHFPSVSRAWNTPARVKRESEKGINVFSFFWGGGGFHAMNPPGFLAMTHCRLQREMQTFCAAESNPPAHSLSAVIHSVAAGEWPGFGATGLSGLLATHPMEGVVG
jgi:hypothetical protein